MYLMSLRLRYLSTSAPFAPLLVLLVLLSALPAVNVLLFALSCSRLLLRFLLRLLLRRLVAFRLRQIAFGEPMSSPFLSC